MLLDCGKLLVCKFTNDKSLEQLSPDRPRLVQQRELQTHILSSVDPKKAGSTRMLFLPIGQITDKTVDRDPEVIR